MSFGKFLSPPTVHGKTNGRRGIYRTQDRYLAESQRSGEHWDKRRSEVGTFAGAEETMYTWGRGQAAQRGDTQGEERREVYVQRTISKNMILASKPSKLKFERLMREGNELEDKNELRGMETSESRSCAQLQNFALKTGT